MEAQAFQQTWELIVRLKKPMRNTKAGKLTSISRPGEARDYLRTIAQAGTAVTFIDGYRYQQDGRTTTHTVTVESPEDIIIRKGEGSMRLTLREV
jgi:hypothetical protein